MEKGRRFKRNRRRIGGCGVAHHTKGIRVEQEGKKVDERERLE